MKKKKSAKKIRLANCQLGEVTQITYEEADPENQNQIMKVTLDFPAWFVEQIDFEASYIGIERNPLIKIWLHQKLEEERKHKEQLAALADTA